jgi:ABC-type antimicrobial peptide transport system permease subunit
MVFAIGMGVLSGIFPAQRAAQLDPVRALKYE